MISICNREVNFGHFPDGSLMKFDFDYVFVLRNQNDLTLLWHYENDEEMVQLYYTVKQIRTIAPKANIILKLPYIPNARMDRVKRQTEVFTLKFFCEFINALKFDTVLVLDPHSNVSTALLDNVQVVSPSDAITHIIDDIEGAQYNTRTNAIIYFPDEGAYKRYKDLACFRGKALIYGKKNRDWTTGKILGLDVYNEYGEIATVSDVSGKTILMVDDIISYGGTLAYSADKLRELGAAHVYAFASHTENSILDEEKGTLLQRLNNRYVDELFTTDSLYTGSHPSITVINLE